MRILVIGLNSSGFHYRSRSMVPHCGMVVMGFFEFKHFLNLTGTKVFAELIIELNL